MNIETILMAMEKANDWAWQYPPSKLHPHAERQYHAFRARILKMDAEKDARIAELEGRIARIAPYNDSRYWFNRPQPKKELHGGRK